MRARSTLDWLQSKMFLVIYARSRLACVQASEPLFSHTVCA